MNEKWIDNLRQQMEQYESTQVPDGLWEGIEQHLDNSQHATVVPMWRRMAAACIAVGVVVVAGLTYLMFQNDDEPLAETPLEQTPQKPQVNDGNALTQNIRTDDIDNSSHPSMRDCHLKKVKQTNEEKAQTVLAEVKQDVDGDKTNVITDKKQNATNEPFDGKQQHASESTAENKQRSQHPYYDDSTTPFSHNRRKGKTDREFKVALFASQMPQSEHLCMNGYLALSEHATPDNSQPMLSKGRVGAMDYLAFANDGANPVTDAHHQQPVRIGISLGYDINKRWGVSIGASYTKLKSTLTAGTESSYYTNDQTINYIGVPVSVTYTMLRNTYVRLYATAGGMVEFGAGGTTIVETMTRNQHVATEQHDIDDIPVQLSANIGGGAELRVYRSVGIFAEAGAAYFLDNNSKYSTIYSTHPLNLNLQFGIRWNIGSWQ